MSQADKAALEARLKAAYAENGNAEANAAARARTKAASAIEYESLKREAIRKAQARRYEARADQPETDSVAGQDNRLEVLAKNLSAGDYEAAKRDLLRKPYRPARDTKLAGVHASE
ncbi:hypothetical protein [Paraburkholderia aromaticivorans]|uniref:hypothetical protein n=1 Tax=Paraburkholderia aromaticivorans TaxID=2026199 RepID=UPI001455F8DE|nr:hypothetical protein [Paraburkholderia aromaticivorans]